MRPFVIRTAFLQALGSLPPLMSRRGRIGLNLLQATGGYPPLGLVQISRNEFYLRFPFQ